MLINKEKDMTPFAMGEKPAKQYPFLMPLVWGGSYALTRPFGLTIQKKNMEGIKPPFLVLSTHQGFSDYYIGPLALFPHRGMYVSDMEGFAGYGKWLYRGLGCIGKRRYVPDIRVMTNIRYALSEGQSVMIFPESRHSNIGTTAYVPKNLGRLVKCFKVPLVILSVHGSYLANPFWDETHTRKVPMEATMECIGDAKKLSSMSAEELQRIIEEKLSYDEYAYQHEKGFLIREKNRAKGLEKALYQCRDCKSLYHMQSEGSILRCGSCGREWTLTEDGWLQANADNGKSEGPKIHPPHWYEWQRDLVIEKLKKEEPNRSFTVRVEALPNEKGFVDLGEGTLTLDREKFTLKYKKTDGTEDTLLFPHKSRESLQTEYDYREKGMCIVLSTTDCCYYLYCKDREFQVTELQFISEALYLGLR